MEKTNITIFLKDGDRWGCVSVSASIQDGQPAITFISSGYPKTVLITEVTDIKLCADEWCPQCE